MRESVFYIHPILDEFEEENRRACISFLDRERLRTQDPGLFFFFSFQCVASLGN